MKPQISGRYREVISKTQDETADGILDLRIDVDGERPLNIISGDLCKTGNHECTGSFRFGVEEKMEKSYALVLEGNSAQFDDKQLPFQRIKIIIPHDPLSPEIDVQLSTSSGKVHNHVFRKQSQFFRNFIINHVYEDDAKPLDVYDTRALGSPSQRTRPLSLSGAFAEAGLELTLREEHSRIAHPRREDAAWIDTELQNALLTDSSFAKQPQGSIWLLSALEYVICTVKGIMIVNPEGTKRGCVVFQNATGWETPEDKRLRLFIYLHELGHCLNLKHPWAEAEGGDYSTLSWMNYPWRYQLSEEVYGSDAFWRRFNFQFSDFELLHLRHGFRNQCM